MEYIIFENDNSRTLICFDDEFTSIDYEFEPDSHGDVKDGNFLFEIDDVRRVFELEEMEEIVRFLQLRTKECSDAKEAWSLLLRLFDDNDIECDADESEGHYSDDGFVSSNL